MTEPERVVRKTALMFDLSKIYDHFVESLPLIVVEGSGMSRPESG